MTEPLVQLKNIHKGFAEQKVLRGLSLSIQAEERVSILGRSGCGKTTLLRILAGLETPDEGQLLLHGNAALKLPPWQRGIQFVFQDLGLWPTRTAFQNVYDALRAQKKNKVTAKEEAMEALSRVSLKEHAQKYPAQLSGGEARRLAFARALALRPELLLLDEPYSSLDETSKTQSQEWLQKILGESKVSVLLVTHTLAEAEQLGGRVMQLKDGVLSG